MNEEVPYLGSKISLISKANIRYEGILYTIDTVQSTVALAKVKSFGTEDRETDRPVAKQDEIFEFIIFRGTDIKDLHVCEPPIQQKQFSDPAIVKQSQPIKPPTYIQQQPTYGSNRNVPLGSFSAGMIPTGQPPVSIFETYPSQPQVIHDSRPSQPQQYQRQGPPRSETPPSRSSPTVDQGTQATAPYSPASDGGTDDHHDASSPPPLQRFSDHRPYQSQAQNDNRRYNQNRPYRQYGGPPNRNVPSYPPPPRDYNQNLPPPLMSTRPGSNQNGQGPSQPRFNNQSWSNQQQMFRGGNNRRGGYTNQRPYYQQNRPPPYQNQGAYRPPNRGGMNRGGPRGGPPMNRRPGPRRPEDKPADFDFESANADFEKEKEAIQIERELKKLNISDKAINGDTKEGSVEEDEETITEEDPDEPEYYNKSKSFFDDISCEAKEREKGVPRTSWKEERKINVETFGYADNRGYRPRGGFRGRGYGRPRGRGMGWYAGRGRGGYGHPARRNNQAWIDYEYAPRRNPPANNPTRRPVAQET